MSLLISPVDPMAKEKKRTGRPPKGRNDVTVRLDAIVASRAGYVAKSLGMSMAEYLTAITKERVDRDFKKAGEKLAD